MAFPLLYLSVLLFTFGYQASSRSLPSRRKKRGGDIGYLLGERVLLQNNFIKFNEVLK